MDELTDVSFIGGDMYSAGMPFLGVVVRKGTVVGATYPEQLAELRKKLPHTMFLVPGYGAQGGGAQGVAGAFDENGRGAIVNSSRAIMCAWKKEENCPETDFAQAARREAIRMRDDITSYLHH